MAEQHETTSENPQAKLPSGAEDSAEDLPVARPVDWSGDRGASAPAYEILLTGSSRRSAWIDLASIVVLMVAFEMCMGVALAYFLGMDMSLSEPPLPEHDGAAAGLNRDSFYPALGIRALGCLAIIALIVRSRRQTAASLGLHGDGWWGNIGVGVGSTVAVYLSILVTAPILWFLWPDMWKLMEENAQRILTLVPKLHPLGFVAVSLAVGLYEEILFRGFLMTRLRRATGSWAIAVIVSSAIFAALHLVDQTAPAVVWVTVLSLVFSLVTIWRKSIIPAIVGHFLFDLSQFMILYFQAGDEWS
jgi:membrane protease YdiL (CAAX protease family)